MLAVAIAVAARCERAEPTLLRASALRSRPARAIASGWTLVPYSAGRRAQGLMPAVSSVRFIFARRTVDPSRLMRMVSGGLRR